MQASAESATAPTVEFKLFKSMAYGKRVLLILCFVSGGILFQLFMVWWWGLPLVFFGVLLGLCTGVTNKPPQQRFGKWENVTLAEFARVMEMFRKTAKWGRDCYALNSYLGCAFFIFVLAGLAIMAFLLFSIPGEENTCYALAADGFLMFFLLFVTGQRSVWQPEGLQIKIEPLLHVSDNLKNRRELPIEISPMLELQGKGEKQIPRDCKMMLKLKGAPAEFYGIQVQTSLNDVQGTKFPYMYCVLLGKPGSGLVKKVAPLLTNAAEKLGFFASANDKKNPDLLKKRYMGEVAEAKVEKDVELLVIRQVTLGTGYHTQPNDQLRIVNTAINLARQIYGA